MKGEERKEIVQHQQRAAWERMKLKPPVECRTSGCRDRLFSLVDHDGRPAMYILGDVDTQSSDDGIETAWVHEGDFGQPFPTYFLLDQPGQSPKIVVCAHGHSNDVREILQRVLRVR